MFSLTYKGVIFFPELYAMKEVFFCQYKNFFPANFLAIHSVFLSKSVCRIFYSLKSPIPAPRKSQMVGLLLQAITAKIY